MANEALDTFLNGDGAPAPVAETPSPEPAPQAPEPKAPEPANDEDEPLPIAAEGEPVVPRRALEDERHKRQDWKEKATRAEVERDMLAKQIEELKKAPPPAVQRAPMAPIDPNVDPQGFVARIQSVMLNERLNTSELLLRKEIGADKVDAAIAEFKQAADADQALYGKLYAQHDPYGWMAKEVERMRLQREIGDDPAKWREAERQRLREEMAAEAKPQAAPVSPVAGLPPSLANVRSAGARSAPAFSGPPSLSDILAQRK